MQQIVLGTPEVLNSIATEYSDEENPVLEPCRYNDYKVSKVIRSDLHEIQGDYPEEIHVECITSTITGDTSALRFEWVFDSDLERIKAFNFGLDPSEFDGDD